MQSDTTPLACGDLLALYSDYDDSLLSREEEARVRAHMDDCSACARYDRVLRKGRMLARQASPPAPSADFMPRLRARLREVDRRRSAPTPWSRPGLAAALGAVTVLLAAGAAVGLLSGADPVVDGPVVVAALPASTLDGHMTWETADAHVAGAVVDGRVRSLPATGLARPRPWTDERVAPAAEVAYSPLVIGPPAYRAARPGSLGSSFSTRRTLD